MFPSSHELITVPFAKKNSTFCRLHASYCWYASALNPVTNVFAAAGNQTAIEYETGSKAPEATADMIARRRVLYKNILVITTEKNVSVYSGIARTVTINELLQMKKEEMLSIACM